MVERSAERALCPCGCGFPAEVTLDGRTDGEWIAWAQVCEARAALETARKQETDPPPGEVWRVRRMTDAEREGDVDV